MENLQNILYKVGLVAVHGSLDLTIDHIEFDSRGVKKNTVFVAIPGTNVD